MLRVGLTGNIASGKSTVARTWASLGAPVVDADELARRAVAPGTPGLERVRDAFGGDVITDGALNRPALRRIVFADPAARARLEGIVHPEVARLRAEEESRLAAAGAQLVVHDIPLIFEVGLEDAFDVIVVVDATAEVRAGRLAADRGLSADEIRGIMAAQMDPRGKRRRADVLIENEGTIEDLRTEAGRVWRRLLQPVARAGQAALRRHDRFRVDMHVHTRLSFDSLSRPDAVVARAMARGLDRICITDHDEIEAALDLAARYPNRIIPGEEVKTREGVDIIGLYLEEWIPGGTPARETCERIREQGGLVYVPHPFAGGKGGGGRILSEIEDLVHIVEGFNARIHHDALNQRARDWAGERRLPVGAGSDAHTLGEIGNGYVDVPAFDNDAGSFLTAVRGARLHGTEASRLVHIASTLAKLVP